MDKDKLNFCEWFDPSDEAFDAGRAAQATKAENELAALFDDAEAPDSHDDPEISAAEDLFK